MDAFEIIEVRGTEAFAEWERRRVAFQHNGLYPVLLGSSESVERLLETEYEADFSREKILERAASIDPVNWIATERAQAERYEFDAVGMTDPPIRPLDGTSILDSAYGRPLKICHLGLIPVGAPHEVFAAMAWGGWNECPMPEVHVALHKWWNLRYGAEVVAVTDCEVQCRVADPPSVLSECNELAVAQVLYCGDLNCQIYSSTEEVAQSRWMNHNWYFWWD